MSLQYVVWCNSAGFIRAYLLRRLGWDTKIGVINKNKVELNKFVIFKP